MPPDTTTDSWSESDISSMNFKDTELTLGLPGEAGSLAAVAAKGCMKRGFLETVDFSLGSSTSCNEPDRSESRVAGGTKPPNAKVQQVVGWPPVRSYSKKAIHDSSKYIKVAVDGAPYLRKVDLDMYSSYEELLRALDKMFSCFLCKCEERKLVDPMKGTEYVPTYEDKDGDWMLVGDVPWTMFIESCKRIRLKKSSDAASLAPRPTPKCKSTS